MAHPFAGDTGVLRRVGADPAHQIDASICTLSQAVPLDSAAEGAGYTMFGKLLDFMGLNQDLPAATKVGTQWAVRGGARLAVAACIAAAH